MDNKIPESEIKVENRFAKKFENFWYYHKWKVIVAAFAAFVIGVCVYSCVSKPKLDITVLYAGPFSSQDTAVLQINEDLSAVMPESIGTDGAAVNVLGMYTEEQCRALAEQSVLEYIEEEKKLGRNYTEEERASLVTKHMERYRSITRSSTSSLGSYIGMGNYTLYFLDPSIYETYRGEEVFVLLSDVFGEAVPASAYSDDAIKLCETSLYKNNPKGVGKLPADTLICLRLEPVFKGCGGGNSDDYNKAVEMFKAIAE